MGTQRCRLELGERESNSARRGDRWIDKKMLDIALEFLVAWALGQKDTADNTEQKRLGSTHLWCFIVEH